MNPTALTRGLPWALISAATFGFSGPLGSSLLEAGWSSGATTLLRIAGAAVLMLPVALVLLRRHGMAVDSARTVLAYGVFAVAGAQLCFFYALQHLSVGVALLLEFLAPVLLVGWTWFRTRRTPSATTFGGCMLALVGLAFVVDVFGPSRVDLVGIVWGLAAAVCVCVYFLLPGGTGEGSMPPLLMISGGMVVGAVLLTVTGLTGITPLRAGAGTGVLGGIEMSWVLIGAMLVVISTVVSYVAGVVAIRRLDTRVASFVGLSEVLFGVLAAWLLVSQVPTLTQLIGGVLILAGIVVIRRAEVRTVALAEIVPSP
ncbi:DMT family transporter [Pseudonocardia sp. KRD291]|uniref:EamA family transporter n=1 Tax=Pseudonocardia sp. KRD291 TaxID=2792007 RepID=UPI001C4A376F|nr:EamA family transporter [Pseudonocardia sp. KRD291]MBW0103561.1 EamA family transporter [Pseudonocardia sp. KRD291]